MAKSKSLSDLVELDEDVMSVRTYEDEDVLEERPKLRARYKWIFSRAFSARKIVSLICKQIRRKIK